MASESKGPDPEDLRLIAEANPVYSFFGHSCSTGEELPVPDGCIIVTLAVCGVTSYFHNQASAIFEALFNDEKNPILLDPITNKDRIEELMGLPKNSLNVNHPNAERPENRMYMNTSYDAQLMWDYRDFMYHSSGLYRFPSRIHSGITYGQRLNKLDDDAFASVLEAMYTDEIIYPSVSNLKSTLKELGRKKYLPKDDLIRVIGEEYSITQQKLFEEHPGIYYLMSCRPPCSEDARVKESVIKRRRDSRPWVTNEMFEANLETMKKAMNLLKLEHEEVSKATRKNFEEEYKKHEIADGGAGAAAAAAGFIGGRRSKRTHPHKHRHRHSTLKRRSKGNRKK